MANQEFLPAGYDDEEIVQGVAPSERDPDDVALANVLAELGSSGADAKVNVYQIDEKKNRAFVGSFLPGDFSIEVLQAQYGAGEYAVEVRKDKKWLKKTTVKIAAPKNPGYIAPVLPRVSDESPKIIEAMQAGFNQMGQMFAQALGQLAANQPKQKSTMETLQELQLMREILGGAQSAPAPDPMAMVTMALELSEKIRPREGEPGTGEIIMEAVKNFAPTINKFVETHAAQQAALPAVPPIHGPAVQIPAPLTPPATPENFEMDMTTKLYARTLIAAAKSGADPMTYANNVLDLLPEEKVLEFVGRPDWFEDVAKALPEAVPFRPWFESMKECILELTSPDDGASVEGNATPPSDHAA